MLSFSHGFGWAFQETRGTAIWPASHSLSKTSLRQAIPLSYPVQRIFVSCFQVRKGIGPSKWAKNPWGYSTVIMLPHIHSIIFVWLRFDLGRGPSRTLHGEGGAIWALFRAGELWPLTGRCRKLEDCRRHLAFQVVSLQDHFQPWPDGNRKDRHPLLPAAAVLQLAALLLGWTVKLPAPWWHVRSGTL